MPKIGIGGTGNIDHIQMDEQASTPATPAAGKSGIFLKADGLYVVDDAGAVTGPLVSSAGGGATEGALTDYSATSTVVGWSSFTAKQIYYKKIGKVVHVLFRIVGTSNSTSTSFTVPSTSEATIENNAIIRAKDNGGTPVAGLATLVGSSSTVACYPTPFGGAWTASNEKWAVGQMFYVEV